MTGNVYWPVSFKEKHVFKVSNIWKISRLCKVIVSEFLNGVQIITKKIIAIIAFLSEITQNDPYDLKVSHFI